MSENTRNEGGWRQDSDMVACSGPLRLQDPVAAASDALTDGVSRLLEWKDRAMRWTESCTGLVISRSPVGEEEQVVHDLCSVLEEATEPAAIRECLLDAVRRITRGAEIVWAREGEHPRVENPVAGEIHLDEGSEEQGPTLVAISPGTNLPLAPATLRRIKTLCAMASWSLARVEGCDPKREARKRGVGPESPGTGDSVPVSGVSHPFEELDDGEEPSHPVAAVVQDATFLMAVLPFALGQARRHQEPLALLSLAIDRLAGIRELLGEPLAEQAMKAVGEQVGSLVRSSDVVSRMDDDRFVVVLPRAQLPDALRVAQKICRAIARNTGLFPELGGLTVSVGVAESPSCAETVYGLIDAAESAMDRARTLGRNQAVAAPGSVNNNHAPSRREWEPARCVG